MIAFPKQNSAQMTQKNEKSKYIQLMKVFFSQVHKFDENSILEVKKIGGKLQNLKYLLYRDEIGLK